MIPKCPLSDSCGRSCRLRKYARAYKNLWDEIKCKASQHCKPQIQRAGSKQAQLASSNEPCISCGADAALAAGRQRPGHSHRHVLWRAQTRRCTIISGSVAARFSANVRNCAKKGTSPTPSFPTLKFCFLDLVARQRHRPGLGFRRDSLRILIGERPNLPRTIKEAPPLAGLLLRRLNQLIRPLVNRAIIQG
jgi:hypothetical protein